MNLFQFALALSAYFALHSILAAPAVKRLFYRAILPERYYRLVYNLLSIGLLLPLAIVFFALEKRMLFEIGWLKWPGTVFVFSGLVWVVKAMQGYDLAEFIGLWQLRKTKIEDYNLLNTSGLNSEVRHPLYYGTMLVIFGVFLLTPSDAALVIVCISLAYIIIGSVLEERKLVRQFGEAYRAYQREVPMLFPFRWKHRRK